MSSKSRVTFLPALGAWVLLVLVSLVAGCGDSGPKVVMPEKPTPLPDESARFGNAVPSEDAGDTQVIQPSPESTQP